MVSIVPACPALSPDSGASKPPYWEEWLLYIQEGTGVAMLGLSCREGTNGEGWYMVRLSALG